MLNINSTELRSLTNTNATRIRTEEKERKQHILQELELRAKKLFKGEYLNVISEIEKQVQNGFSSYSYPILAHSHDRKYWNDTKKRKDGNPWIAGHYGMIRLTRSNIYQEDLFDFWETKTGERFDLRDDWEKETILYGLLARKLSGKFLRNGLSVSIGDMEVVNTDYRHQKLRCLHISW